MIKVYWQIDTTVLMNPVHANVSFLYALGTLFFLTFSSVIKWNIGVKWVKNIFTKSNRFQRFKGYHWSYSASTILHKKWSFMLKISLVNVNKSKISWRLFIFSNEILNGNKRHLCSVQKLLTRKLQVFCEFFTDAQSKPITDNMALFTKIA